MPVLRAMQGDITTLDVDVIVNAANTSLLGGGGIDGAIHRAAGPQLLEFCRTLGGCETGQAKTTPGFELPARWVVHTVGPVWSGGAAGEPERLASCYRESLARADEVEAATIVFPAISTGIYGYPADLAAAIAVDAVRAATTRVDEIIFICFDEATLSIYRDLLGVGFAPRTAPDDGAATVTERHIRDFSLDFFSLSGKKAIVTGGNRGLGQAYAVAMAKAGADLYIPTVADDDGTTNELIEAEGRRCEIVTADLTVTGTPAEVVQGCVDTFGGVDIVVNNAGIGINVEDVREFDRSRWDPMVAVNLTAAFEMSHAVSSIFIEQGSGKIINVCSMFSFLGGQRSPAYAATKHGIAGLTKAYADELGPFGVQVNGIAPGYFATELTAETRKDPAYNKAVLDHIPAGEWGQVQDLMGACVFLASAASTYVNGHVLAVDGGYLVR